MKEKEITKLIDKAIKVRDKSYSPYSKFKVSAIVLDEMGNSYPGVNVENGSFGLTNCAERTAIFSAVTGGMKRLKAIAVVADTTDPVSPCGACRQVISEFADEDTIIILSNLKRDYIIMDLEGILPYRFKL